MAGRACRGYTGERPANLPEEGDQTWQQTSCLPQAVHGLGLSCGFPLRWVSRQRSRSEPRARPLTGVLRGGLPSSSIKATIFASGGSCRRFCSSRMRRQFALAGLGAGDLRNRKRMAFAGIEKLTAPALARELKSSHFPQSLCTCWQDESRIAQTSLRGDLSEVKGASRVATPVQRD